MNFSDIPSALQSRLRLAVIAALYSGEKDFTSLQRLTGATAGNLGKQLEVLEECAFIKCEKTFEGRRPKSSYALTAQGKSQFAAYVALLQNVLEAE